MNIAQFSYKLTKYLFRILSNSSQTYKILRWGEEKITRERITRGRITRGSRERKAKKRINRHMINKQIAVGIYNIYYTII